MLYPYLDVAPQSNCDASLTNVTGRNNHRDFRDVHKLLHQVSQIKKSPDNLSNQNQCFKLDVRKQAATCMLKRQENMPNYHSTWQSNPGHSCFKDLLSIYIIYIHLLPLYTYLNIYLMCLRIACLLFALRCRSCSSEGTTIQNGSALEDAEFFR